MLNVLRCRNIFLVTVPLLVMLSGSSCPQGFGPRAKRWHEPVEVKLAFQVVDERTSSPITGASLLMIDPFRRRFGPAKSDGRGFVEFESDFQSEGVETTHKKTGRITFDGWLSQVSADGYVTALVPLVDLIVDSIDLHATPPTGQKIKLLKAGTDRAKSLRAPEQFTRRDEVAARHISLLLYGDRFYSVMSEPTDHAQFAWFENESGRLRRENGVLRLKVERERRIIPDDDDNWHLDNLYRMPWGAGFTSSPSNNGCRSATP